MMRRLSVMGKPIKPLKWIGMTNLELLLAHSIKWQNGLKEIIGKQSLNENKSIFADIAHD